MASVESPPGLLGHNCNLGNESTRIDWLPRPCPDIATATETSRIGFNPDCCASAVLVVRAATSNAAARLAVEVGGSHISPRVASRSCRTMPLPCRSRPQHSRPKIASASSTHFPHFVVAAHARFRATSARLEPGKPKVPSASTRPPMDRSISRRTSAAPTAPADVSNRHSSEARLAHSSAGSSTSARAGCAATAPAAPLAKASIVKPLPPRANQWCSEMHGRKADDPAAPHADSSSNEDSSNPSPLLDSHGLTQKPGATFKLMKSGAASASAKSAGGTRQSQECWQPTADTASAELST
mmetsp:Transcript_128341/g.411302  ORF Transcript_128341/g.411302 Transcript_128341/m.411302 type:complete len:298 (+) Transcript_128341:933-1826(+)